MIKKILYADVIFCQERKQQQRFVEEIIRNTIQQYLNNTESKSIEY
jgi:hypothetical protein